MFWTAKEPRPSTDDVRTSIFGLNQESLGAPALVVTTAMIRRLPLDKVGSGDHDEPGRQRSLGWHISVSNPGGDILAR
jgi:hypothetical protein